MESLKEEFLDVLSQYQGILHKVNLIYFRTEADRKDNFQEITYQLWRSFPKLKDKDRIGSWIYNISINTSISKIRADSRFVAQDSLSHIAEYTDPCASMDKNEDFNLLLEAIRHLDDIDKSIMLLYLEECSYDEIAEITGISKSNVGTRINRAKKTLKEHLINMNYEK